MEKNREDLRLVELFRQGDANAFAALIKRHKRGVFAVAYKLCGNRDDADEIAQETFLRFHRYGHTFKGDASLRTWLTRISVNVARTHLSKSVKNKHIQPTADEHIEYLANKSYKKSLPTAIGELLDELSPDHREVLVLFSSGGYSLKDIASIVDAPIGTVKSRICYAKRHVARLCQERGVKP